MLNKTFLGDQNVPVNFHELKTHYDRVKVQGQKHGQQTKSTSQLFKCTQCHGNTLLGLYPDFQAIVVATCLFYYLRDHNLQNEKHIVLKNTWN